MVLNIGHRGASASRPENTLEAFSHALDSGADGIELDVRRCASGELVVIHDATLKRTVKGRGRVSQLPLRALQKLEIKGGGHIPTLEEVFERIGKNTYCFIEMKEPETAADIALLVKRYVAKGWHADRLIVISFTHTSLIAARTANPALQIGASFKHVTRFSVRKARSLHASFIAAQHTSITREIVKQAHEKDLKIIAWTVNHAKDIAHMRALGVDGIMSDHPERLIT